MKSSVNLKSRGFRSRRFLMKFDVSNLKFPYKVIDTKFKDVIINNFTFKDDAISFSNFQNRTPTFGRFEVPKCLRIYKT